MIASMGEAAGKTAFAAALGVRWQGVGATQPTTCEPDNMLNLQRNGQRQRRAGVMDWLVVFGFVCGVLFGMGMTLLVEGIAEMRERP